MPPDAFRWYVVRAHHGQTEVADLELRTAGFAVISPRLCRPATHARRSPTGTLIRATEERFEPLFVRYIIVSLNLTDPRWRDALDCEGVERIISGGHLSNGGIGVPIALPDRSITQLREMLSAEGIYYPPGYKKAVARYKAEAAAKRARADRRDKIDAGAKLHMTHGPLANRAAVCEASDGQRVMMLMNLMFNRDNVRVSTAQSGVKAT